VDTLWHLVTGLAILFLIALFISVVIMIITGTLRRVVAWLIRPVVQQEIARQREAQDRR
jgi:hypothetical protein